MLTRKLEILPAIDVLGGRAVRLAGGKRDEVTLEGGEPSELSARLAGEGAERLHLVDLDGAFSGVPSSDVKQEPSSKSGKQRKSIEPSFATSAAVCRSPITA